MDEWWDGGKRESRRMAGSEMKDIGILAAAARSDAVGGDSRMGEANGEPAGGSSGAEVLCSKDARLGVDRGESTGGDSATVVRNVILRWIQSIDGL
jgi:hypothetical protein